MKKKLKGGRLSDGGNSVLSLKAGKLNEETEWEANTAPLLSAAVQQRSGLQSATSKCLNVRINLCTANSKHSQKLYCDIIQFQTLQSDEIPRVAQQLQDCNIISSVRL